MSYNFAAAVGPVPAEDSEAWEWIDKETDIDNDSPPQVYHDFIDVLTSVYPCICDLNESVVDDEGVWSDGPLRNNIYLNAPVLGLVYSKVDKVLPFVIAVANKLGLTLFDWGTETIHRPGLGDV